MATIDTIDWAVDANGDYGVSSNWSPSRIPDTNDDASIATPTHRVVTHASGSYTVRTLTVANDEFDQTGGTLIVRLGAGFGGLLSITGGTLSVSAGTATVGTYLQMSGSLAGSSTVTVTGAATLGGGVMRGTGTTILGSSSGIGGTFNLDGGRILENRGVLAWTAGDIHLGANPFATPVGGGTIRNDAGAIFDIRGDLAIAADSGTTAVSNAGTWKKSAGSATAQIRPAFANSGAVSVTSGSLEFDGTFSNSGGTVAVGAGAQINFDGGGALNPAALTMTSTSFLSFGGNATFALGAGTLAGGVYVYGGTLDLGSGNVTVTRAFTQSAGNVTGSGTLTLAGPITFAGTASSALMSGVGTTVLNGPTAISGGLSLDGGRVLDNRNRLTWTGNSIRLGSNPYGAAAGGGSISNAAGALFDIRTNDSIAGDAASSITNAGIFRKSAGTGTAYVFAPFADTATGTMQVQTGTLAFDGGGSANPADFAVSTGATVEFGGGTFALGAGTLRGTGTVSVTDGTLDLGANDVRLNRAFSLSGGLVTGSDTLTLAGGGTFDGIAETMGGTGTTILQGTSTIGDGFTVNGQRTLDNKGMLTITGSDLTFEGTSGLHNEAGGKVFLTNDAAISRDQHFSSDTNFVNAGLLDVTAGSSAVIFMPLTNMGKVSVEAGASLSIFEGISAAGGSGHYSIESGGQLVFYIRELDFSSASQFTMAADATLEIATTYALLGSGTLAGNLISLGTELSLSGSLSVNGKTQLDGISLDSGSLNLRGDAELSGEIFAAGTVTLQGSTSIDGNLYIDDKRVLSNYGTIEFTAGDIYLGKHFVPDYGDPDDKGTGSIVNRAGATFDIGGDLLIDAYGSPTFSNAGLLRKSAGSSISTVRVALTNTGTVEVASGTLDLAAAVGGTGQLKIDNGAALELGSTAWRGSAVHFDGAGLLRLDNASGFAGTVAGFAMGDTMDLRSIGFGGGGPTLSYKDTSSGGTHSGTLTVSDGTHMAKIAMLGDYLLANFSASADSGTGTSITFADPPQSLLALAGQPM